MKPKKYNLINATDTSNYTMSPNTKFQWEIGGKFYHLRKRVEELEKQSKPVPEPVAVPEPVEVSDYQSGREMLVTIKQLTGVELDIRSLEWWVFRDVNNFETRCIRKNADGHLEFSVPEVKKWLQEGNGKRTLEKRRKMQAAKKQASRR